MKRQWSYKLMHLLWSFMVDGKMRASVLFTFSLSRKIIGTATNTKPFSFRYKWFHVISLDTSTLNTYTWDDLVLLSWGWVLYLARTVCANGLKKHFLYMFFFFFSSESHKYLYRDMAFVFGRNIAEGQELKHFQNALFSEFCCALERFGIDFCVYTPSVLESGFHPVPTSFGFNYKNLN